MAMSLAGKTAIITGAGSGTPHYPPHLILLYSRLLGINYHFARALLANRCNVVLADLALRPEAEELVANHQSPSRAPARATFQKTDVRRWEHLELMFRTASKEYGGADVVCPGAGVFEPVCWRTHSSHCISMRSPSILLDLSVPVAFTVGEEPLCKCDSRLIVRVCLLPTGLRWNWLPFLQSITKN